MSLSTTEEKVSFIRAVFGKARLMNDGINAHVRCPECGKSDKKKFVIRLDNDLCHCFVCGLKGRTLAPILKKYFPKYYREYCEKFLGTDMASSPDDVEKDLEVRLPDDFTLLVDPSINLVDPDIRDVLTYLKRRGMSRRDMWYFKFGVSVHNGFRRRAIFPSYDSGGNLNFYTGRDIDGDRFPKYLNAAVDKKEMVFNELFIDWASEITLVEGPFDLVKCNDNATCLLGSFLACDSLLFQKIIEHKTPVLLALDPDAKTKTIKIARSLLEYDVPVRMLDHGEYEDVGDMTKQEFSRRRQDAKSWNNTQGLLAKIQNMTPGSIL